MSKHSYPRLIFFIFIIAALSTCQSPKGEEKKPEDDYSFSFRKEQKHFKKASDACKTDSNECASVVIDYLQFKEPTPAFQRINDSILFYVKTTLTLNGEFLIPYKKP